MNLNHGFSLLCDVTRRQNLVRIDTHDQIDDFVRGDFAEPMRRVWRNDDDVAGSDFAAQAILDTAAFGAGTVQQGDYFIVRRNFLGIIESATGHQRSATGDDMINLSDLAVLDAAGGLFAGGLKTADYTDSDVVFTINADDANGLIADAHGGYFTHQGVNFGVIDVCGRTAGQMRSTGGRVLTLRGEFACDL